MERSAWVSDPKSYDPSAMVCFVTVDGETFEVANVMGPGWYMNVHYNGRHVGMAGWNDWAKIETVARKQLAGTE